MLVEFNEPLDPGSVPVSSRFAISGKNGNGANYTRTVSSVAITDNLLTLGLTAALPNAGTIQIAYSKPLTGAVLRDPDLLPVASFTIAPQPLT